MGGHIALSLLRAHQVETLLLIAPAIYAMEAFAVPFGPGFSEIIRRNESWQRADVLEPLQSFRGNLLIYVGEDDAVIPPGVIDLLDEHSPNASTKRIVRVPGWGHRLPVWLAEDQAARMVLAQELRSLLTNQT
jgi:pimeloyl-ACP methyl ester carboxylesterase